MSLKLRAAEIYVPRRIRVQKFRRLFALAALAFGEDEPRLDGLSFKSALREFALFTARQAERHLAGGAFGAEAEKRLRDSAFAFGLELRRDLRLRSRSEVMRASRLLYRLLGIDFHGAASGGIAIRRCFFADFYTPQICGFIAALDEGLLTGLAGGGRLEFFERITEGRAGCQARFRFPGELP